MNPGHRSTGRRSLAARDAIGCGGLAPNGRNRMTGYRAADQSITKTGRATVRRSRATLARLACALLVVLPVLAVGAPDAQAATFTPLALQNGWSNAPFSTPRPAPQRNLGRPRLHDQHHGKAAAETNFAPHRRRPARSLPCTDASVTNADQPVTDLLT